MLFSQFLVTASLAAGTAAVAPPQRRTPYSLAAAELIDYNKTKPDATTPAPVEEKQQNDTPKYYFEFHYTDDFVNVGDLWLWDAIWQRALPTQIKQVSRQTKHTKCMAQSNAWGTIDGISGLDVRNQVIQSLWDMVVKIQDEHDTLYKDCRPCGVAKDGCFPHANAACGLGAPDGMCICQVGGKKTNDMCMEKVKLMKIPSAMELRMYDMDGSLRADGIRVTSHSEYLPPPRSNFHTCGRLGAVAEVALSFLPVFGKQFGDTVKVLCRGEIDDWSH
ncbi:hypothetical protein EJ03DRAFT_355609 [Teratosphaeria nubilosa]|uniref:Uncharacterized protein n=1 Tax=Teratosphaeria nubilosa TaxID=161662 RepID=A0A6G1KV85_9PEZI|nr:hypothetical protein EJ03DRAFT_355609 [Teratosphaeria nubilosa]